MYKESEPTLVIDITNEERKQAETVRKEFKKLEGLLDAAFDSLNKLNGSLQQFTDSSEFVKLDHLFVQYRHKLQHYFNDFIDQLQVSLDQLNKMISDTETKKIRDTIIGESREIRDGALNILELLGDTSHQEFLKNFKETFVKLNGRRTAISEIITDQFFTHIDKDILGKIKLGRYKAQLSTRRPHGNY